MKALDLFCGGGGASMGIKQAGFDIRGVDITPQGNYPFNITITDALKLPVETLREYDFIWASPPCQAFSRASTHARRSGKEYPDLIDKTRQLLLAAGKPFVIENVPGAPIRKDLILCGTMFGLKVFRHRYFEIHGFRVKQPPHHKHNGMTGSHRCPYRPVNGYVQVTGNMFTLPRGQKAMRIPWIRKKETLAQAIPPAYSEYICEHLNVSGP